MAKNQTSHPKKISPLPKNFNLQKMYSIQAIQDVDEFVLDIWKSLELHHLLTNGSSAVNGCRQNESPNS